MSDTLNHKVAEALSGLAAEAPLRVGAAALLGALGYESRRTLDVGTVQEFLERLNSAKQLTEKQHALFEPWRAVEVVFQFSSNEIGGQPGLFDGVDGFDQGRIESFLFLAVELSEDRYGRTQLAEMTRAANRLFKMPVIILFRHGATLTLAAVHRRVHKRDGKSGRPGTRDSGQRHPPRTVRTGHMSRFWAIWRCPVSWSRAFAISMTFTPPGNVCSTSRR